MATFVARIKAQIEQYNKEIEILQKKAILSHQLLVRRTLV